MQRDESFLLRDESGQAVMELSGWDALDAFFALVEHRRTRGWSVSEVEPGRRGCVLWAYVSPPPGRGRGWFFEGPVSLHRSPSRQLTETTAVTKMSDIHGFEEEEEYDEVHVPEGFVQTPRGGHRLHVRR